MPPTRPTVVGLYGVPGCGKTRMMQNLKTSLGEEQFAYYEGSEIIASLVPGGLDVFKRMGKDDKAVWRERAIREIGEQCSATQRVGLVAGHLMFWDEDKETGELVWTKGDEEIYTHIFYLDTPADVISRRRLDDAERPRPAASGTHLRRWQISEQKQLRLLCLQNSILFANIAPDPVKVAALLRSIRHSEEYNLSRAQDRLDDILRDENSETLLVLDGDRTVIPEDTGALFWALPALSSDVTGRSLKDIFSTPSGYSYHAFRQASLLYEEIPDEEFEACCEQVASAVTVYPQVLSMLRQATDRGVKAVIISCGLRAIWEKILSDAGLSGTIKVIAGSRIKDNGFIVTGEVKRALVAHMKQAYGLFVWAFGDSVLDLPMLTEADRAIVVVGEEDKRSRSMENALLNAIDCDGLRACQVLIPDTISPRLDIFKLPVMDITHHSFVDGLVRQRQPRVYYTKPAAAKLLMSPMRDARVFGPSLRTAHSDVGQYLATNLLSELIGLEEYPIPHVQGHQTSGYRFCNEEKTLIAALMRGGEPMAQGVNQAMPLAMFVHAYKPEDIKRHHVEGRRTLILVDSVVNTGKTLVEFIHHVRTMHTTIQRIFVVAGVIQAQALSEGRLADVLRVDTNVWFVALRQSENKFTGKGTTDTGHRLFNTTHLD
ncbi:uracil phosphoribosyltransferase-domain-containing protein [Mucidula mucida]|nr:uracil phosphoribosyltransferase-domain-containing protein [Mucidula mucida]